MNPHKGKHIISECAGRMKVRIVVFALLCTAVGIALQCLCALRLIAGRATFSHHTWLFAAFPAGACLLAYGLACFQQNVRLNFWHYFSLCLFLPFYGAAGALIIAVWRHLGKEQTQIIDNYSDYISVDQDRAQTGSGSHSYEQRLHEELTIQSYHEILEGGNEFLKKALIGKLMDARPPEAVSLLKLALNDSEYEIRSYSATALTEIENLINEEIHSLIKGIEEEPRDIALKTAAAKKYLDYVETGLPDPNTAREYIKLSLLFTDSAESDADTDNDALASLLRQRIRAAHLSGDEELEMAACEKLLAIKPDATEAMIMLCEARFRAKDFQALYPLCGKFEQIAPECHPAMPAAHFWIHLGKTTETKNTA